MLYFHLKKGQLLRYDTKARKYFIDYYDGYTTPELFDKPYYRTSYR